MAVTDPDNNPIIELLLSVPTCNPDQPHPLDEYPRGVPADRLNRADLAATYTHLSDMVVEAHNDPEYAPLVANHLFSVLAWYNRTYTDTHFKRWAGAREEYNLAKPRKFWLNYGWPATQLPTFRHKLRALAAEALSIAADHRCAA